MDTVCESRQCTMCNACALVCPKNCIKPNQEGNLWYMAIDKSKCVSCHLCEKVCPNCSEPQFGRAETVYAAWANDRDTKTQSASGGVAAALYIYAISYGMYIAGVELDDKYEAHFNVSAEMASICGFQNSKYTFSYTDNTYEKIYDLLMNREKVLFIGLPCQVAGLNNYLRLRKAGFDRLYTVDLICHGTPMPEFLQEHIHTIEEKKEFKADKVYFRDPKFGTGNFLFTIYGKQIISHKNRKFSVKKQASPVYKKLVISNDLYQIGYHSGWIYRECCYQCHYAKKERTGDLTIGDFHGLGKVDPYNGPTDKVSCLFVNTQKGQDFLNRVQNLLHLEKRPLAEPYSYEPQLSHPSKGGQRQKEFAALISDGYVFEKAAAKIFGDIALKNYVKESLHIYWIKESVKRVIPTSIKNKIKKFFGFRKAGT